MLAAALLAVCGAGPASAQTNPCTDPLPTTVLMNPSAMAVALDEQNVTQADGTPMVTEYQIGYFAQGVDPQAGGSPTQTTTVPKASMVLQAGTTNCYKLSPLVLAAIPIGQPFVAAVKARRVSADPGESAWSVVSNPFGRSAVPGVPGRPAVRK